MKRTVISDQWPVASQRSEQSTAQGSPVTPGVAIFLLMCLAGVLFQAAPARADALEMLKKTYAEVQTVETRFDQKIMIATLKRERESKGEFYYKRSKGFLWKYSAPAPKIFLYDGKAMWQSDEDKPFVVKERVDKARMQGSFFDLVDDVSKLDELFNVREAARDKEGAVLLLTPKKEGMLQSARMWLDIQYLVKKIEISEATGNVNLLSFSAIKVNKGLSDSLFVFSPGKKEIVER
jgi:chaperone LolA